MRKSSGMISARISPRAKTRTTERSARRRPRSPRSSARSRRRPRAGCPGREEVLGRAHVHVDEAPGGDERPVVLQEEGAVQSASSFTVSRSSGRPMWSSSPSCPKSGSRISGRDCSVTTSTSPMTKSVPIFRPSRPFASELDGEVDDLLERAPPLLGAVRRLADQAEGGVQHLLAAVQVHPLVRTKRLRSRFRAAGLAQPCHPAALRNPFMGRPVG